MPRLLGGMAQGRVTGKFRNDPQVRRAQRALILVALVAAAWIRVSTTAAQGERDADIDRFLSRIPPVIGEFEACLDANPVPGLILVRDIRQIVLSRLFWRMRERGDTPDVISDRLAVAGRQTEQMRQIAGAHLREISADPPKLERHCEHTAIQARDLLEALR